MKQLRLPAVMTAATLSGVLLLTGCGASKEIKLYGSEEEYGKAELCDYSNLAVEKNVYEITDEMVDEQIDSLLYDYTDYTEVDRPSQEGDSLSTLMTISSDGEVLYDFSNEEEGGYLISLGYGEFGEEFDEKLTGAKKGDTLSFTISYDDDFEIEEFAGKTIDYDVVISSVTEEIVPDLTDAFITDTLGYESEAALREATKESLSADYEESALSEVKSSLLQQVIDSSTYTDYPEELYATCRSNVEQNYASYIEMFGVSTLDEIYDMFQITSEDIDAEALDQVYQMITINQIAREQDMKMSQKEYDEMLAGYAEDFEYESVDDMISDYGQENLKFWIAEEKVYDYLLAHATVTEVPASIDDEYLDLEEDEEMTEDDTTEQGLIDDMEAEVDDTTDAEDVSGEDMLGEDEFVDDTDVLDDADEPDDTDIVDDTEIMDDAEDTDDTADGDAADDADDTADETEQDDVLDAETE